MRKSYAKILVRGKRLSVRPYLLTDFGRCRSSHEARLPSKKKFDAPISFVAVDQATFRQKVLRSRKRAREEGHFIFGVFDRDKNYVGQVDFFTINSKLRWGNLGYQVQNQYARRGYASEAARLALTAAFRYLDFHRIEAAMEPDHKASRKVAKNAGMRYEGIRRKFFAEKGGVDMAVYGANAMDWKA